MAKDLRSYLKNLESHRPEEVITIDAAIRCEYEVSALQTHFEKNGQFPLIICNKPISESGSPSKYRLITNLLASRRRCADAIGIDSREIAWKYTERSMKKIEPITIKPDDAPVREMLYEKDDVDLGIFPVVTHHEFDIGPYVTAGFVTTVDPDSGISNVALQRCWVKGRNVMGVYPAEGSDNWINIHKWWKLGKDAPISVWLGHHPGVYLGGASYGRIPYPESHYPHIGGILEEPLRLVSTKTHGDLLKVPADAEIVIEGFAPRNVFEAEGPFGERVGYVGGQRPNPIIKVTAISCRKDAYWHDILVGHPDNFVPGSFANESLIYSRVRQAVPQTLNVHVSSAFRDQAYIQVQKTHTGVGRAAAVAALTCKAKQIFVFDEDVDIFDEMEVIWAVNTRTQWDRDLIIVTGVPCVGLDPSVPGEPGIGAKAALDCTMPAPPEPGLPSFYPPVNRQPKEIFERIRNNVDSLVSPDAAARIPKD